ncbi:hypothetical protein IAT38_001755 [Cryptococcus sp. DSM 104549]
MPTTTFALDPSHHTPRRRQESVSGSPEIHPHNSPRIRPSPILTHTNPVPAADPNQPQFAELLTPLKLRRRKIRPEAKQQPTSLPLVAGPSRLGYYTLDGDLYRGATRDPTSPDQPPAQVDEDAISLGSGSTSSSSSNWSWGSGNLDIARAVIGRVGEALGVRRGSNSSGSDSSSSESGDEHESRSQGSGRRRRRRRMGSHNRLSRTLSGLSRQTSHSPERPKREHLPKKREFTLLLPPKPGDVDIGVRESVTSSEKGDAATLAGSDWSPKLQGEKRYPPDRVVVTPSLPVVIEHIRSIRLARGFVPLTSTPPTTPGPGVVPVRRGGSAPGRTRNPKGAASFVNPPVPTRPPASSRTQSRLHALRGDQVPEPVRPKSVSDLLGLARPNSTGSLTSLRADSALPTRTASPVLVRGGPEPEGKSKPKGCWWLDVSCPTWEDLRDIGELLGLHPLTLEDVLQQDPREKLDIFDKLGYYFLVVRSLDESYFKYTPGTSNVLAATFDKSRDPRSPSEKGTPGEMGMEQDREGVESKVEGRRRGWGMGRATGKMATKSGEKVEIIEDRPGKEGLEGVGVGAVNVYLVVFADGVVSFHFEDISKHTRRVLDRVLSLTHADHSADWIAHGLLDSIVDAFFPLIRYVDGAVDDIDSLTIDPTTDPKKTTAFLEKTVSSPDLSDPSNNSFEMSEKVCDEKNVGPANLWRTPTVQKVQQAAPSLLKRIRESIPSPGFHLPRPLIYVRLFFLPVSSAVHRQPEHARESVFDRSTMLRRITDMRKLVTGLTRLLSAKGAVVGRLRKRASEEGGTVAAYIGDVEDHILLLQTSLYHYEYILSHCQPAYFSHLNVSFAFAREGTNKAILTLSVVAISILPMQFSTSIMSINAHTPHNGWIGSDTLREPDGSMAPFNWFAAMVVWIFLVACVMVSIIRYWRWLARKKFGAQRGLEMPSFWEGYWGWS